MVASSSIATGASWAAWSASEKAAAEAKRCSGRLAIARWTTASKASGAVTAISEGFGGVEFSAFCMIAVMLPSNGRSPVSNWYSTTPAE